jgi:periplasmic divalent cation tolerance protein
VLIKTRAARYAEVEAAIRGLHPYELPEIIAVPVVRGFDDYLRWVADETSISIG